ncbi:hypothetical protein ACJX0J_012501, partial [Zea mays]
MFGYHLFILGMYFIAATRCFMNPCHGIKCCLVGYGILIHAQLNSFSWFLNTIVMFSIIIFVIWFTRHLDCEKWILRILIDNFVRLDREFGGYDRKRTLKRLADDNANAVIVISLYIDSI